MAIKIGRIFIWWIILFLVMLAAYQTQFYADFCVSFGTAKDSLFSFVLVMGMIVIALLDAIFSED